MRASEDDDSGNNKFPARRCSVRIALGDLSDVQVAGIFRDCGFDPARDFKCIQKVSAGAYLFVFRSYIKKERCLDLVDKFAAANMYVNDVRKPFTFVRLYGAPCELPDALLELLLGDYGNVRSLWRQTYRDGPFKGVETGTRFARLQLFPGAVLPPYFHFGNMSVAIVHDGSEKCCRKCHNKDHMDFECRTQRCARCEQIGHGAEDCQNNAICILCKSELHCCSECDYNWAKPKIEAREEEKEPPNEEIEVEESDTDASECKESGESDDSLEEEDKMAAEPQDSSSEDPPTSQNSVNGRLFSEVTATDTDSDTSFITKPGRRRGRERSRTRSPDRKVIKSSNRCDAKVK